LGHRRSRLWRFDRVLTVDVAGTCEFASTEVIYDGLFAAAFFDRFVLTMDLARGLAWVTAR